FNKASGRYVPVDGSHLFGSSLVVDAKHGLAYVILDRSSFPQLVTLNGTVFTIGISPDQGASVTTGLNPAVALALPGNSAAFTQQASFQVATQVTIALSPSQDAPQSSARGNLS